MTTGDYHNRIVWIIGASSGIGRALARELDARGATLALSARREEELEMMNTALRGRHRVFALDITEAETVARTARAIAAAFGRIDHVICLAAAYTPMRFADMDMAVARQMVDINLSGMLNVAHAVLPVFEGQTARGQLALCGSVAGYIGLPGGQPYSATKAAIINLAESLRVECRESCDVRLISPGFVRTPLTDKNSFDMPMMIEPEAAAQAIADGLLSRRFEIHFPKRFTYVLKLLRLLPYGLLLPLLKRIRP